MPANRCFKRSCQLLRVAATAAALFAPGTVLAQQEAVQKPFESGKFSEALDAAAQHRDDPANTFIAGHAAIRMNQGDRAREEFGRLESNNDRAWQLTGKAALALLADNVDEGFILASEAVGANGDNPFAHYELGLAASRKGDHARSAEAFDRATQIKPDFAYAHYYAGVEYQRAKQMGQAGDHLRRFLELAPDAPERGAVTTLLRSLRG